MNEAVDAEDLNRIKEFQRLVKEFNSGQDVLQATGKLLSINPEYYTAWNERKRAIERLPQISADFIAEELQFNVSAIKVNPKSYVTWEHRRWLLKRFCSSANEQLIKQELLLLEKLLKLDNRNCKQQIRCKFSFYFTLSLVHGWNYRIWLAEWARLPISDEFDFTSRKIYENFSNYSAWHRRTLLFVPFLEQLPGEEGVKEFLKNEVELCRNAAWTEPADQSVWFYQRWLFFGLPRQLKSAELVRLIERLAQEQLESILQLIEEEPEAVHAMSFAAAMGKFEFYARLAEVDHQRRSYWQSKTS